MEKDNQLTGNIGLFYVAYMLSRHRWNVLTTTRNAKGVDIVAYGQDGRTMHTIQVKTLQRKTNIPFGKQKDIANFEKKLIAEFLVAFVIETSETFIAKMDEVKRRIKVFDADGKVSVFLKVRDYEDLKDKWEKIGEG